MNVFVLSTGRCGSKTFARACSHITNYSCSHESKPYRDAAFRLDGVLRYPTDHIEVDNRLSWFCGALEKQYGDNAFYVHLLRKQEEVARSLVKRGENSILYAFASGVLQHYGKARNLSDEERFQIALRYCETVNENISLFLSSKSNRITMWLNDFANPFEEFWQAIGARGDLEKAMAEWEVRYNKSS